MSEERAGAAGGGTDDAASGASDRLHVHVQRILRAGIVVSVTLMVVGLVLRSARGLDDAPAVRLWQLFDAGDVGLELTALGILVLAVTPAVRALVLVGLWWRERDYRFVAVALAVVTTLLVSVFLGKGG